MTAGPTAGTTYQLELGLGVPRLAIEPEWKAQQRLWGHPFHPMCSYLASFPAALTHAFIARYSRPGDVVLDLPAPADHGQGGDAARGPRDDYGRAGGVRGNRKLKG